MGKSLSASLTVSAVISFALLALYRYTTWFLKGAVDLEGFYGTIFVLPNRESGLAFHEPVQYLYIALISFVSTWVCMELPRLYTRLVYLASAIFLTFLLSAALSFCGLLFEPYSGVTAIVLAGIFGVVLGSTEEGQRQRRLHPFFVGRVSEARFQEIVHSKEPPDLSGRREVTVLTCRVLNYPELSSQMEACDVEQMTTAFLEAASGHLVASGGYLDSCSGEGVRVLYGLLDKSETHALDACRTALELRSKLAEFELDAQKRWSKKPVFGIAVATGPMTIGLFGVDTFQSYGAVGEALDFSRRLCSINLVYGSQILLGSRTYAQAKDQIEARPMEMVYAPRMHQISEVYELLATKGGLNDEEVKARHAFWQGVVNLRKGDYKTAAMQLKKAGIEGREDAPLRYFLERAEAGVREDSGIEEVKPVTRHMRMLTAN